MLIKINILDKINNLHPFLWGILKLSIAFFCFTFILFYPITILRPISLALRTGFGIIIPLTTIIIYIVFRIPGKLGEILPLIATMSLFALGLAGLWASGNTQSVILNGLLPLTDAAGYYTDALRLQYGSNVSNFTAMRPLYAGLLSFFLWISNNNLMIAVSIFTAITGFSCYLACKEIQKTHGAEVAVFFLILTFLYYRHHSGTTMSESLGVPVSLLGVALLWKGIYSKNEGTTLFGIGMIALALNIRPGAMFVLPGLLLWGGWIFRKEKKFSFKFFISGLTVVLSVFYINSRMIDFVAGPSGVAFENFSWAFYGLSSGGKSWTYIFEAHPELRLLQDSEVTPTIYKLAFKQILNNPSLMIKGSFFYWQMFFSDSWYNAYAFVAGENYWISEIARWGMYILGALGIYKLLKNYQDPYTSLAGITAVGVLASVPFVPPTDAYRVRLYAATIPFFILLPGMGVSLLLDAVPQRLLVPKFTFLNKSSTSVIFSIVLILTLLLSPIYIKKTGTVPTFSQTSCPASLDSFLIRYDDGSSFTVYRESQVFIDQMPDFHMSTFRRNAHSLPDTNLITTLENIEPPKTLSYSIDLLTNNQAIIIAEPELLPVSGVYLLLCGNFVYEPDFTPYSFFYVEQVFSVEGH